MTIGDWAILQLTWSRAEKPSFGDRHCSITNAAAVESQLVHLRAEMRDECSAVRGEVAAPGSELRGEIARSGSTLRDEMSGLGATLRDEIRAGDEETRRYMRVVHEDLVSRIALLQESGGRFRKRR